MLDTHSHILPGLDDGAAGWEQSLAMARMAVDDGIEGMVCTPHWVLGRYTNTRPLILNSLEKLQGKLADHNIPLQLYPGAELRLDPTLPQGLRAGDLLTLNDTGRFALIELPEETLPRNLEEFLWDLRMQGITPVISHPERNLALRRDPARLYRLVQMGALAQLTAASLLGHFGKEVRKFSTFLLDHNLVHVLVTDAHGLTMRTPKLFQACKLVEGMKGKEVMRQMTCETPKRIIRGDTAVPADPIPIHSQSSRFTCWKRFFPFFLKATILTLFLSACAPVWSPPIKEIYPAERENSAVYWNKEKHRWEHRTEFYKPSPPPGQQDQAERPDRPNKPNRPKSTAAVQQIQTERVPQAVEEKLIQLQRLALSPREYIKKKFKGKQVIFPDELPREQAQRPIYKIGAEDELSVFVWQNADLSGNVIVRNDGKISLPLVGELQVAGLQVSELEALLKREYARYLENPQVTVSVKAVNSLRVFITGAIRVSTVTTGPLTSGFPLRGDNRLLTALSQVQILPDADLSEAYIVRGDVIIPLDLKRLLKDGDMTQNVLLKPADTIVIPGPIKEITILGEVKNPGRYKVKQRTTLLDALAAAGGVKRETAALYLAYVVRHNSILPVNFKRLIDMGDMDQNILIEDKDIIDIPSNRENKIFVMGEVRNPGVLRFVDPMDVMEAITEAGDFLTTANRQQVVVVRGGLNEPKVYAINAMDMMKGLTHERFILHRYDIVYVPRTSIADWNVFINQLLPSMTFGNAVKRLGH